MAIEVLQLCYANSQRPSIVFFVLFIVLFANRKFLFFEGSNFAISCGFRRVIPVCFLCYCNEDNQERVQQYFVS